MFKKATKQELVISTLILFWIFAINIVAMLITTAPMWPMFFVIIFFFVLNGDVKKLPMIFLSGAVGITFAYVIVKLLAVLAPSIGVMPAMALLIFAVLAVIIVGGSFAPLFLNNVTFAYLTVCAINIPIIEQSYVSWMITLVVGGAIIIAGALGIFTSVTKAFAKGQKTAV